jgi:hypothetical protein
MDAGVDSSERSQKPAPCVLPTLQHFFPNLVSGLPKLGTKGRNRIELVVHRVTKSEKTTFLSRREEHQSHHHGQGGLVYASRVSVGEQASAGVRVGTVDSLDQHLDGTPHLEAQPVGDIGLVVGRLYEHRLESILLCDTEKAPESEE